MGFVDYQVKRIILISTKYFVAVEETEMHIIPIAGMIAVNSHKVFQIKPLEIVKLKLGNKLTIQYGDNQNYELDFSAFSFDVSEVAAWLLEKMEEK